METRKPVQEQGLQPSWNSTVLRAPVLVAFHPVLLPGLNTEIHVKALWSF